MLTYMVVACGEPCPVALYGDGTEVVDELWRTKSSGLVTQVRHNRFLGA